MELQLTPLAVYNYNHGGRILLTKQRKMAFLLCLFLSLAVVRLLFPFGLLALIIPAIVYLSGERTLKIGSRYLISGERIVYYANVKRLIFTEAEGTLVLRIGSKTQFVIERNRFKNKASRVADFSKVAAEITEKVRLAAPDALKPDEVEAAEAEA